MDTTTEEHGQITGMNAQMATLILSASVVERWLNQSVLNAVLVLVGGVIGYWERIEAQEGWLEKY